MRIFSPKSVGLVSMALTGIGLSSCATVAGSYAAYLAADADSPRYAKAWEMRETGKTYTLVYSYGFSESDIGGLHPATWGYELNYATFDRSLLGKLCGAEPLPTLRKRDLILERTLSRRFAEGAFVGPRSVGCEANPVFKIVDEPSLNAPARTGLIATALAADGTLFWLFPAGYAIVVATGGALLILGGLVVLSSLH